MHSITGKYLNNEEDNAKVTDGGGGDKASGELRRLYHVFRWVRRAWRRSIIMKLMSIRSSQAPSLCMLTRCHSVAWFGYSQLFVKVPMFSASHTKKADKRAVTKNGMRRSVVCTV